MRDVSMVGYYGIYMLMAHLFFYGCLRSSSVVYIMVHICILGNLWLSGVLILLLLIISAFLGYILPWGQMSYWGATVITNLASTALFWRTDSLCWLWGGFSVDNPT